MVKLPFDGQTTRAIASFVPGNQILIGTHLLRQHELNINFPTRQVQLQRVG